MYMSYQPLVSICIPSYNHERYIAETIASVILQDYQNIELIIIDDCSIDNSDMVIRCFIDKCKSRFVRFEYLKNDKNKGISYNLNQAIKWAQGRYFYAIASDDILMNFKTSFLVSKFENLDDQYAAIFGNAGFINQDSKEIYFDENFNTQLKNAEKAPKTIGQARIMKNFLELYGRNNQKAINNKIFDIDFEDILKGNYLPAMSNLMKIDIIKDVGLYTEGNAIEDLEMLFKLTKKYKIRVINRPVAWYRIHSKNTIYTIRENLLNDEINLLLLQKEFAFSKNLGDIFYNRLQFLIRILYDYNQKAAQHYASTNGIKIF